VRIYTNLHPDVGPDAGRHAVSASVAGQVRSMRLDEQVADTDSFDRLNVTEIPLKVSPKSIAVNSSACNLAVGLQTRVLIYGLNGTKVAGSQHCFR